jgi:hypothetical protein
LLPRQPFLIRRLITDDVYHCSVDGELQKEN